MKKGINGKSLIKIQFTDFWSDFNYRDFYLYKLLENLYELEISEAPDVLFYSVYTNNHKKFKCTKILFTGENVRPNFWECDFAFSFDYLEDSRNYRLPLFALYDDVKLLIKTKKFDTEALKKKTKFCCFIVSNPNNPIRNNFFLEFLKYRHIDSAGELYNNIGGTVEDKRNFIKDYKFVIAFENSSHPGYVTEKIFEPLLENCIPIYWGDDAVKNDFNSKRFINYNDFDSPKDMIDYILELDVNDQKFIEYLNEPVFNGDILPNYLRKENINKKLIRIIESHMVRSKFAKVKQLLRPIVLSWFTKIKMLLEKVN